MTMNDKFIVMGGANHMKNVKKMIVMFLVIMITLCNVTGTVEAKTKKMSNKTAECYARKVNALFCKNYPGKQSYKYRRDNVIIYDFNHDGVKELLYSSISNSMGCLWDVYTYKAGKAKKIGSFNGGTIYRTKKKNQYRYVSMTGVGCHEFGTVKFYKNKISVKREATAIYAIEKIFKVNGKKVSQKKYASWEKNFKKGCGKEVKITSISQNTRKITASKLKKIEQ